MTTIVAPPSNASKWQMGFNSAFKGLNTINSLIRRQFSIVVYFSIICITYIFHCIVFLFLLVRVSPNQCTVEYLLAQR